MKRLTAIISALSAFMAFDTASAQSEGAYFTGSLGLVSPMDEEADEGGVSAEVSYKISPYLSGAVGYAFGNGFRIEGELSYSSIEGDEISASNGFTSVSADLSDAEVSLLLITANAFYDIQTQGSVAPYLGGGIGFARSSMDDFTVAGVDFEGDTNTDLAAFGEVGVNVPITESFSIVPAYRFVWIDNGDSDGFEDSKAHVFKVGARFPF